MYILYQCALRGNSNICVDRNNIKYIMENISTHLSVIDGINGISYTSNRFILGLLKPGLTDFFWMCVGVCSLKYGIFVSICPLSPTRTCSVSPNCDKLTPLQFLPCTQNGESIIKYAGFIQWDTCELYINKLRADRNYPQITHK